MLFCAFLSSETVLAQLGFCSGNSGGPIFTETFGTGTNYGPALPGGTTNYDFVGFNGPQDGEFPNFGEDIEWSLMLHGEQTIRLSRPIPPEGKLFQTGVITNIYDKGKGAVFHAKITGETEDGNHLYDAHWAIFYLGAGGFGGDPGPKAEPITPPEGVEPDFSFSCKVAENQAVLYRLSGDLNPLHLDPAAAKRGGFDRPILHGLCTYGIATRSLVSGPLDGDVSRLKEFKARFSSTVYPGDTLTTECWKTDGGYIIQAKTENSIVLSNALAVIND